MTGSGAGSSSTLGLAGAGLGLREPHLVDILREVENNSLSVAWFEILGDNFMGVGGYLPAALQQVRREVPFTLHGVGLNLGGVDPLDPDYLRSLKQLAGRLQPALVSEHLCFTAHDGLNFHDLLPIPYTEASLRNVRDRVLAVQDALGRTLVVENVSAYLRAPDNAWSEAQFLARLSDETDCQLLLDLNNLYVNHRNLDLDMDAFLDALPWQRIAQVHLAGFSTRGELLVDTHSAPVSEPVWQLLRKTLSRRSDLPVMVEWDNDIPAYATLLGEATIAADHLCEARQRELACA